jgi:hypothetical protein
VEGQKKQILDIKSSVNSNNCEYPFLRKMKEKLNKYICEKSGQQVLVSADGCESVFIHILVEFDSHMGKLFFSTFRFIFHLYKTAQIMNKTTYMQILFREKGKIIINFLKKFKMPLHSIIHGNLINLPNKLANIFGGRKGLVCFHYIYQTKLQK